MEKGISKVTEQWRCVKDIFKYCDGVPEWEQEVAGIRPCKNDPANCGRQLGSLDLPSRKAKIGSVIQ